VRRQHEAPSALPVGHRRNRGIGRCTHVCG
jgi:hypothetical protein